MKLKDDMVLELSTQIVEDMLYEESLKKNGDFIAAEVWLSINSDDWAISGDELPAAISYLDFFLKAQETYLVSFLKQELGDDDLRAISPPLNEIKARLAAKIKVERQADQSKGNQR